MIRRKTRTALFSYTVLFCFFFNDTATTEIYTLSLHDALPISSRRARVALGFIPWGLCVALGFVSWGLRRVPAVHRELRARDVRRLVGGEIGDQGRHLRSEEHTSELQSLRHLVCRLLLDRKNNE